MFPVIPHVGMWIEIKSSQYSLAHGGVIPHVGMWIEIPTQRLTPSSFHVIPHVGMWIEMLSDSSEDTTPKSSLT